MTTYNIENPTMSVPDIANLIIRGLFPNGISSSGATVTMGLNSDTPIPVAYGDSASIDAFGRLRTSNPVSLFANKQLYDNQPLFWDDQMVSGTGTTSTFNTNRASSILAVSANKAGKRIRQTKRRFNYQSGKSQLILMTGIFNPDNVSDEGITRCIGLFDDNNGLFVQYKNSVLSLVRRSYVSGVVSDFVVNQSNWNIDKLDGTGASGIKISISQAQIIVIDFQWLGVGRVRFGFEVDGHLYYCHEMLHSNKITSVYMSTPNLPIRYSIENDGTGLASSLEHICSAVNSEAGFQDVGVNFSVDRGANPMTTLNTANVFPLLAVRLNSSRLGTDVIFTDISMMCDSTSSFRWCLLLNPIISGTAISYTDVTYSGIQAATAITNGTTVYNGIQLASGYSQQTTGGSIDIPLTGELRLGSTIAGTSDILVVGVVRLSTSAETFYASLAWKETV